MEPTIRGQCHDCGVEIGQPHIDGCDVARCTECGFQRISCDHYDSDVGWGAVWTGIWPGEAECLEFGWYSKFTKQGWVRCGPDDEGAGPDLSRLMEPEVRWSREHQRFVLEAS